MYYTMKTKETSKKAKGKRQNLTYGFTLLEVLVTVAIIGVLFIIASSIFINTIRSANKANATNEAKENASLVIEALNRDVRNSTGAAVSGGNSVLTLTPSVTWECLGSPGSRYLTRQTLPITNRDPVNGVSLSNCGIFSMSGTGSDFLVTIDFSFTQASSQGSSQDLQALVRHKVSFSNRAN